MPAGCLISFRRADYNVHHVVITLPTLSVLSSSAVLIINSKLRDSRGRWYKPRRLRVTRGGLQVAVIICGLFTQYTFWVGTLKVGGGYLMFVYCA